METEEYLLKLEKIKSDVLIADYAAMWKCPNLLSLRLGIPTIVYRYSDRYRTDCMVMKLVVGLAVFASYTIYALAFVGTLFVRSVSVYLSKKLLLP